MRLTPAVDGAVTASATFRPSSPGRWRLTAKYDGTRGSAPSTAPNFVALLVADPLRE